jgi:hypothetical protein
MGENRIPKRVKLAGQNPPRVIVPIEEEEEEEEEEGKSIIVYVGT